MNAESSRNTERGKYQLLVLDWGIGGLPLFSRLRKNMPEADILYFSDAGYTPYGRVNPSELRRRLEKIIEFASSLGIPTAAVACNAMSSILRGSSELFDGSVEVLSLIHHWLDSSAPLGDHVGVIGGHRTVESGIYQNHIAKAGRRASGRAAQELSALIEAGNRDGIQDALRRIISPIKDVDSLILACTHYPAVSKVIAALFPDMELIDPLDPLFDACLKKLKRRAGMEGRQAFLTTGDPARSEASAEIAFGIRGIRFLQIPLDLELSGAPI